MVISYLLKEPVLKNQSEFSMEFLLALHILIAEHLPFKII